MPFKSKAQQRFMFAAENRGQLPKGTAERWARETPNIKNLPEKVKKTRKQAALITAYNIGFQQALRENNLEKNAGLVGGLLSKSAPYWIPALAGAAFMGPQNWQTGALLGLAGGALGKHIGLRALRSSTFAPEELKMLSRYRRLGKLSKKAPEVYKKLMAYNATKPIAGLALSALGGAGAGYLGHGITSPEGFTNPMARGGGATFPSLPAVSDMATHYAGLVPEGYY